MRVAARDRRCRRPPSEAARRSTRTVLRTGPTGTRCRSWRPSPRPLTTARAYVASRPANPLPPRRTREQPPPTTSSRIRPSPSGEGDSGPSGGDHSRSARAHRRAQLPQLLRAIRRRRSGPRRGVTEEGRMVRSFELSHEPVVRIARPPESEPAITSYRLSCVYRLSSSMLRGDSSLLEQRCVGAPGRRPRATSSAFPTSAPRSANRVPEQLAVLVPRASWPRTGGVGEPLRDILPARAPVHVEGEATNNVRGRPRAARAAQSHGRLDAAELEGMVADEVDEEVERPVARVLSWGSTADRQAEAS